MGLTVKLSSVVFIAGTVEMVLNLVPPRFHQALEEFKFLPARSFVCVLMTKWFDDETEVVCKNTTQDCCSHTLSLPCASDITSIVKWQIACETTLLPDPAEIV